jgi:hypothetical protein
MYLWDRILPQAVKTFNMLRTSRINPKLLAATHILDNMISTEHHWHPLEEEVWLMKHQEEEELGIHMVKMAGTLDQHWNITDDIRFTLQKLDPFPSSSELATQAAADLTHALLDLKSAGPFCQVRDEQMIALKDWQIFSEPQN